MDLDGVHLKMELQPQTPNVAGASAEIQIDGACSEVELV